MTRAAKTPPLSVAEYLALEETSNVKHEYVAGALHALAGTTRRHNRIAMNVGARLWAAARGTSCRVAMADVKLKPMVGDETLFYYPDVMVSCGPEPENPLYEDAPCVLVEITSPSTESIDRREKSLHHKRLASLRSYLVVAQEARRVTHHYRDDEGRWWDAELEEGGTVTVPCLDAELRVEEIYEGV